MPCSRSSPYRKRLRARRSCAFVAGRPSANARFSPTRWLHAKASANSAMRRRMRLGLVTCVASKSKPRDLRAAKSVSTSQRCLYRRGPRHGSSPEVASTKNWSFNGLFRAPIRRSTMSKYNLDFDDEIAVALKLARSEDPRLSLA